MFLNPSIKNQFFVKFHTIPPEKDEETHAYYPVISLIQVDISLKILTLILKQLVNLNLFDSINIE